MVRKLNNLNILINPEIFNSDNSRIILNEMFEILDNIPGVKFLWHSDFYNVFYEDHYAIARNLYSNSYALMGKIFTNMVCIEESESEAIVLPDILFLNENVKASFLKMIHTLINNSINALPIIDEKNELYEFKCECHDIQLKASSILSLKEYITKEGKNLYNLFWPNNKEEFTYKFSLILRLKEIAEGYNIKNRKYKQIEYSSKYISNAIHFEQTYRDKFLESMVRRIHKTQDEARRSSLKDEQIVNSVNRRFYITKDNGRIHYNYPDRNSIKFIELSLDHDKGL